MTTEIELNEEQAEQLAALSDDERAALEALTPEELAELAAPDKPDKPQKAKGAAKKSAQRKPAAERRADDAEPPHPSIDEQAHLAAGYHPPTIPAVAVDADGRAGFKVAEPGQDATHIAFEDGSTHTIDAETGRIADKV